MSLEDPGYETLDGIENALVAYRLSHAVSCFNVATGAIRATFEVYAKPDDAEPPIAVGRLALPGEIYTRLSYPDARSMEEIQKIELDLSYIDHPRRAQG